MDKIKIRFKFNEKKTTQVASLFIEKEEGRSINYMKLIKLLYFVDREALIQWERPLTGDTYFSMKHGPVLSEVLDIINNGEEDPENNSYWYQYITEPKHYEIELKGELPEPDLLSKREMALIEEISNEFKGLNKYQVRDICHEILPEWEDVGDSRKLIEVETILKEKKTADEINQIAEEIDNLNYVKEILSIEN